jgi:iron complex transport system substrate-binding protein
VRIVSLLPSLTEIVCALGHRDEIVGVTHECDYPPGVELLPHLTRSRIPSQATSAEIDAAVAGQGGSLYELDGELLAMLRPDLILTQSQCDVCAVNEGAVRSCAMSLPGSPKVESVNPTDWKGVAEMFARVGELLGDKEAGERLAKGVDEAAETVRKARQGRSAVAVALLEWFDPPFVAGHWIPDLIAMAGGRDVLGRSGAESKRATWEEVAEADPDVILLSPCGFSLERSETELPALQARPEWANLRAVREGRAYLIDGNSYFSRPGPRLRESLLVAASAIDPERCGDLAPATGWRRIAPIAAEVPSP